MLSAKNLISRQQVKRYIYKSKQEGLLCFQLSATDPKELGLACQRAAEFGANLIDLNCGCPVTKIRKKAAGSKLLANTALLGRLIESMRANTDLPISIKIRIDGASQDQFNVAVAKTAQEAGVNFLIIHGRHWSEDYTIACHYDQIAEMVAQVNVPVIANGDVSDLTSLQALLATGCDAAMIARASVGQPWLFAQLSAQLQGKIFIAPDRAEIGKIFLEHIQGLIELEGEHKAILQARKLGKYYARQHIQSDTYFLGLNKMCSFAEAQRLVEQFFN